MGNNDQEIVGVITAQDLTSEAINSAKKNFSDFGKNADAAGEQSSKAFKGAGFAAHELTRELGFTGPAARFVSHEVADMASTLGTAGSVIGGVTILAIAAYKVYEHLIDVEKQKAEAIDRSIKSLQGEVTALYANSEKNDAVTKATYNLLTAKKALLVLDYTKQIELETAALTKQVDSYNTDVKRLAQPSNPFLGLTQIDYQELVKREALELAIAKDTLEKKKALLAQYSEKTPTYGTYSGADKDTNNLYGQLDAQVQAYKWYTKELKEQEDLQKNNLGVQIDAQVQAWKWYTGEVNDQEKLQTKNLGVQIDAQVQAYKAFEEAEKLKQAAVAGTVAYFSQALDTMATLGGQYGRNYFEAYKVSATAEAIISTYQGAAKALGQGGIYGYALAAGVIAAGLANVAKIQSQTYDGGGAGSGAATSSSTSSSSGTDSYKYFNYEQSTYGTGWRPGSSGSGLTLVVHGDVIASDANSVQKWVTKAVVSSMQNNEYGMNAAVKKYAK